MTGAGVGQGAGQPGSLRPTGHYSRDTRYSGLNSCSAEGRAGQAAFLRAGARGPGAQAALHPGHRPRQVCRMDRYGFSRTSAKAGRMVHGSKTGDIVRAQVPDGKKTGTYIGRVAARAIGRPDIGAGAGILQGISWHGCRLLHQADGYAHQGGAHIVAA